MRGEFSHGDLGRIGSNKMKVENNEDIDEVFLGEERLVAKHATP